MLNFSSQAEKLKIALKLESPPIAVTFSNSLPTGVSKFESNVAAGCSFWQEAATTTFATVANDHQSCSIGIHTHNLAAAPASHPEELQTTLKAMLGLDYVRPDEVAAIPVARQVTNYVIYGPLSDARFEPDVVLLFCQAQQSLILTEAVERVDQSIPLAMGRPACAVIPQVLNKGQAAMSLGCCGARTYLDAMTNAVSLWALPSFKLNAYVEQIETLANANSVLSRFHQARRTAIEAGERTTVAETLKIIA